MTAPTTERTVDEKAAFLASAAFSCFGYFAIALVALHVLRPDYVPRSHMISDYAVGPHGWIMTIAFLALSLGCLTFTRR